MSSLRYFLPMCANDGIQEYPAIGTTYDGIQEYPAIYEGIGVFDKYDLGLQADGADHDHRQRLPVQ